MHRGGMARIVLSRSFSETFSSMKSGSHIAGWSSLVARRAHNPEAVGSNPAPATKCSSRPSGGFFVAQFSFPLFGSIMWSHAIKRKRVIGQKVCPVLGVDAGQRPFFIE